MNQITLRGMEPSLKNEVRRIAARQGISLNKAALLLLRKGAGMTSPGAPKGIGDGLDDWIGCMTVDDACAISEAVADLDRMSMDHQ